MYFCIEKTVKAVFKVTIIACSSLKATKTRTNAQPLFIDDARIICDSHTNMYSVI